MTVQTNETEIKVSVNPANTSVTETATMRIYGVGGTGINLISNWMAKRENEKLAGYATIDAVGIDTSRSNLLPNALEERFYHIEGLDGGGKLRNLNVQTLLPEIKPILSNFQPRDVNVLIASAAGGSGSVLLPLLSKELIAANQITIAILVLTDGSQIETENSRKTIATLANMSKQLNKPFVVHFVSEETRERADRKVREMISDLAMLFSNEHLELDRTDLKHFINYNVVTSAAPSLAALNCYASSEPKTMKVNGAIAVAELQPTTDIPTGIVHAEYNCVGYPRKQLDSQNLSYYYTITTDEINGIVKQLEAREEEFKTISQGRKVVDVIRADDTATDSGLVL